MMPEGWDGITKDLDEVHYEISKKEDDMLYRDFVEKMNFNKKKVSSIWLLFLFFFFCQWSIPCYIEIDRYPVYFIMALLCFCGVVKVFDIFIVEIK